MSDPKHYDQPKGDPELGPESARDLEAISNHIEKWWGKPGSIFHEIHSDYVHVDLHVVPASAERPYHTVITSGMNDRPMKRNGVETEYYAELLLALPPEWPIEEEAFGDERIWWPYRHLTQTARFPHAHKTRLWYGHTISGDEPLVLKIREEKEVYFFTYIPLFQSELNFARQVSSIELLGKLDQHRVTELVNKARGNVCR